MLADLARRDDVIAFDLFGDLDLRADRVVKRRSLTALVDAAMEEEPGDVIYGASFENHPKLVERLAERHTLLGNPPEVLRAVRDPARLAAVLGDLYARSTFMPPSSGCWLRKPLRGGEASGCASGAAARCRPGRSCRSASTGSRARWPRSATGRMPSCSGSGAARGTARVRRARIPLVREPRSATGAGAAGPAAGDLLPAGGRVRPAGTVRRRLHLGRRRAWGSRSSRARPPRSR